MYIIRVLFVLLSVLSRRAGALEIPVIIVINRKDRRETWRLCGPTGAMARNGVSSNVT